MEALRGRTALVTGASQGIGRAVALALAEAGADLHMTARSTGRLEATLDAARELGVNARGHALDLGDAAGVRARAGTLLQEAPGLDIVVNNAGVYGRDSLGGDGAGTLHRLWTVNVAGTCALTQALVPALVRNRGDLVFMNSSIVNRSVPGVGAFAMCQHALRAFADSLRAELNERGVRVASVFAGRTATPRQEGIHDSEGLRYDPARLLQPEDVSALVVRIVSLPATAEVTDIHVRPRIKP